MEGVEGTVHRQVRSLRPSHRNRGARADETPAQPAILSLHREPDMSASCCPSAQQMDVARALYLVGRIHRMEGSRSPAGTSHKVEEALGVGVAAQAQVLQHTK